MNFFSNKITLFTAYLAKLLSQSEYADDNRCIVQTSSRILVFDDQQRDDKPQGMICQSHYLILHFYGNSQQFINESNIPFFSDTYKLLHLFSVDL